MLATTPNHKDPHIYFIATPYLLATNFSNFFFIAFCTCVLNSVVFLSNQTQLSGFLKFNKHQIYCSWHTK